MSASLWPLSSCSMRDLDVGGDYFFRRLALRLLLVLFFELHVCSLLAARSGVFVSHQERSETKTTERLTGTNDDRDRRSPEWQARQVTNAHFVWRAVGARPKGRPKRPSEGHDGTRRKWIKRRAKRFVRQGLHSQCFIRAGARKRTQSPVATEGTPLILLLANS